MIISKLALISENHMPNLRRIHDNLLDPLHGYPIVLLIHLILLLDQATKRRRPLPRPHLTQLFFFLRLLRQYRQVLRHGHLLQRPVIVDVDLLKISDLALEFYDLAVEVEDDLLLLALDFDGDLAELLRDEVGGD